MSTALMLPLFFVLLALTAFFNLAEMALVAARATVLQETANPAATRVLTLKKRPGLFLAAIRAGDLITDLLIGAFVVTWVRSLIHPGLAAVPAVGPHAVGIANLAAFVVVSYVVLVFADLAPKSIALSAPERTAMLVASPLRLLILLARPFLAALEGSNSLILRLIGVQPQGAERVTQAEIRRILSEGLNAGVLRSAERSMMDRVLDLNHRSVRTVMTGRRYVQFLQSGMGAETLRQVALDATASHLLVAEEGNLDRLLGIVSRGDLLAAFAKGESVDLAAMVMTPAYVSENASVLSVLETLKSVPVHMVIVVDEFGSLVGLATLADVLEVVAGDIPTRNEVSADPEAGQLEQEVDGSYLLPGDTPFDDVSEVLPLSAPSTRGYKTVAGLVIDRLRRIPQEGETIDLPALQIETVSIERGTVRTLRLIPKQD